MSCGKPVFSRKVCINAQFNERRILMPGSTIPGAVPRVENDREAKSR
jgi:hypothetical protein